MRLLVLVAARYLHWFDGYMLYAAVYCVIWMMLHWKTCYLKSVLLWIEYFFLKNI
jgi:hypothetical protein